MGPIFFSPGESHTKGLLILLHPDLEGVTEVDIDPKRRFVSVNVTPFNDRFLCVYAPSGHNTREQQARGYFFQWQQHCMESKNEGNEEKIIFDVFICTMDKMNRDNENKIQKLYRCGSNYALSKIIQVNDLEDLWRKVNPDSSEFNRYNRSLCRRSRIGRVYTVKKNCY